MDRYRSVKSGERLFFCCLSVIVKERCKNVNMLLFFVSSSHKLSNKGDTCIYAVQTESHHHHVKYLVN